jgi:beta-mannosidase
VSTTLQDPQNSKECRFGFRKIEVVQEPLKTQPGTSFYFKVNDVPIFLAGSNWIPADSFPARITRTRYQDWLKLLVEGGQNAIRVWGGGYYEDEDFYNTCDELGILVWQDFMFGCAAYPADLESFRDNVQQEAIAAVKRLSHHASLAIFAGK